MNQYVDHSTYRKLSKHLGSNPKSLSLQTLEGRHLKTSPSSPTSSVSFPLLRFPVLHQIPLSHRQRISPNPQHQNLSLSLTSSPVLLPLNPTTSLIFLGDFTVYSGFSLSPHHTCRNHGRMKPVMVTNAKTCFFSTWGNRSPFYLLLCATEDVLREKVLFPADE